MKHKKSETHEIEMETDDVVYISLVKFENSKVAKSTELREIINGYKGPEVRLDFSEDQILMGIEIFA